MSWVSKIFRRGADQASAQSDVVQPAKSLPMDIGDARAHGVRDVYWDRIGVSDPELISYAVNPQLLGAPPWPGTQQSFRLVRTGDSLIIASEGLSDPYPQEHEKGGMPNNGLGLEVLIEVPGWQLKSLEDIHNSWAFSAIEMFAQNTAGSDDLISRLDAHGVMSIELPVDFELDGWTTGGRVGALIGVPIAPDFRIIPGLASGNVRVVPLTLIRNDELSVCVAKGAHAREALSKALIANGEGHRTQVDRDTLR